MPRISSPATRTGDDGTTSTVSGKRVTKDAAEICAYGALDELNSAIGVALSIPTLSPELVDSLHLVQNDLFHLGSEFNRVTSTDEVANQPRIEARHIRQIDEIIAHLYEGLGPLENFTLPGGAPSAASLHLARSICRRAEREIVALARSENVSDLALKYINRLSDALFLMARSENKRHDTAEIVWDSYK